MERYLKNSTSYLKFDIKGAVLSVLSLFSECNTIKSVIP